MPRRCGRAALLLAAVDVAHDLLGREFLVVDIHGFHQALDTGELVGGIENLESGRQTGFAVVGAQQAVAESVKGADPHAARIDRQHRGKPCQHFLCCLVGEGHGQKALRRDLSGLDQPGDTGGEDTGFAATGTGKNQRGLVGQGDGFKLFVVEAGKQGVGADVRIHARYYRMLIALNFVLTNFELR
jgi:hypothetical protein